MQRIVALLLALISPLAAQADVVLNEIVAGASDRLLQYGTDNYQKVGTGVPWWQAAFNDATWATGPGPFGYGSLTNSPAVPIATRTEASMRYLTPTLYMRRSFTVSDTDAVRTDGVQLAIEYNDGFVAYLNGVEIARRNGGPKFKFIFHDQSAYNREVFSATAPVPTTTIAETITVGVASSLLKAGNNVLAIQALNASAGDSTFYVKADLRITGSPTTPVVTYNDQWRYLPGVVEPSGNLYDPTLLGLGKLQAPWATVTFDDASWTSAPGPLGAGTTGGVSPATSITGIVGTTPSLYTRTVFNADAAALAETTPLQLVVQYDDSFVAYINGVEVTRRRIGTPNAFTPFTAVADSDNSGAPVAETIVLDIPANLLVSGSNVLAIQVHNFTVSSPDLYIRADLRTGSGRTLAPSGGTWKYLIGTAEPVPLPTGEEDESTPSGPDSAPDWIELYNNGNSPVSLNGWSLTDNAAKPSKWVFPNVSIPANGYLVVFADGLDIKAGPIGYFHTNFGLDRDGGYVGLFDQTGNVVSQVAPSYPRQLPFYSYARDGNGIWKYSDAPSPNAPNGGNFFAAVVATPVPSVPGRFYSGSQTVTFTCATPGALVRYTTDGSEPTTSSLLATSPVSVTASVSLRARAFLSGSIPSDVVTNTYLIAQSAARTGLPAVCLTGDVSRMLYRPFGIMAISPNASTSYTASIWSQYTGNSSGSLTAPNVAADPSAYNATMQSGKPAERPVSMEVLNTGATVDLRTNVGLRTAGSPYSRPRYVLTNQNSASPNAGSWSATNSVEKPQLNVFFRDDIGSKPTTYPFAPLSKVRTYDNIRLRAGKNDISNPFTRDEFSRRLFTDMGQVTVLGDFCNVYVNGVFKGYFNQCERPRESFFQQARGTGKKFDTRYITAQTDGDPISYNELINFARTTDPSSSYANYQAYMSRMDVVNFADYILFNAYAAMADWPQNNYVMDRERTTSGRWRFSVWDGEGGFGGFSRNPAYRLTFTTTDVLTGNVTTENGIALPIKVLFTRLVSNPEFRLLFADRIQKHMFNGGALDTANFNSRYNEVKNKVLPMIKDVFGSTTAYSEYASMWLSGQGDTTRYTLSGGTTGNIVNVPSRRQALFNGFFDDTAGGVKVDPLFNKIALTIPVSASVDLWPSTQPPSFSTFGGNVSAGSQLTISNPNAGAGVVYYTTDGTDPRAVGGAAVGKVYSGPLSLSQTTIVKARVQDTSTLAWSAVTEATFVVATPLPLQVTELMYNPLPQGPITPDQFEFLELKNTGTQTIDLSGMQFTDGITFTFPNGTTLAAGSFFVLVKNPAQFAARYPGVQIGGNYSGGGLLANEGELLTLRDIAGNVVFSFNYSDVSPWPVAPDGYGNSLVPLSPNSNPNPSDPVNWRASATIGGSPGADDPAPSIPAVLVNEILTNPPSGATDAIEIYNPTAQTADVSGWFVTDIASAPKKFQIRGGAIVPANGYLTLSAADFTPGPGLTAPFDLPSDQGEVRLNSADNAGNLTGYTHGFRFYATDVGVSIGRLVNSAGQEKFAPQLRNSLGSANVGPKVGPVVITELMYNPASGGDEFVELRNVTGDSIPLFDPANPNNTWRIIGIGSSSTPFSLPAGITLKPYQYVILTEIEPSVFRLKNNTPASVPVIRYTGALDNAGEEITLQAPGVPYVNAGNVTVVPFTRVDTVNYSPSAPWPTAPNGTGPSLDRKNWRSYADDPGNWKASAVTGGNPAGSEPVTYSSWRSLYFTDAEIADATKSGPTVDLDSDGLTNLLECALGLDPKRPDQQGSVTQSIEMDNGTGPFLTLRYRRNLSASGFQYFVDTADTPGNWSLGASTAVGTPVNNGDGTETVTRRDNVPVTDGAQRFIRLRVIGN